jgi:hypothetical protein
MPARGEDESLTACYKPHRYSGSRLRDACGDEAAIVDDQHKLLTQLPISVSAPISLLHRDSLLNRLVLPTEYPQQ